MTPKTSAVAPAEATPTSGCRWRRNGARNYVLRFLFTSLFVVLTVVRANAILLDWDAANWTPGNLSRSFDVYAAHPGNDVTVTVSGDVFKLTNDLNTGTMTPVTNTSISGGFGQNSLTIAANLKTQDDIILTVSFAPTLLFAENLTFTIFDIDRGLNRDQIGSIYALDVNGNHVAATITNLGSVVTQTGNGLAAALSGTAASPDSGAGSDGGNATISFGSTPITGFSFRFYNNGGADSYQQIGISDISFTPVPEIDPVVGVVVTALVAIVVVKRPWRKLPKPVNS